MTARKSRAPAAGRKTRLERKAAEHADRMTRALTRGAAAAGAAHAAAAAAARAPAGKAANAPAAASAAKPATKRGKPTKPRARGGSRKAR